jgi:hypothetical protein
LAKKEDNGTAKPTITTIRIDLNKLNANIENKELVIFPATKRKSKKDTSRQSTLTEYLESDAQYVVE